MWPITCLYWKYTCCGPGSLGCVAVGWVRCSLLAEALLPLSWCSSWVSRKPWGLRKKGRKYSVHTVVKRGKCSFVCLVLSLSSFWLLCGFLSLLTISSLAWLSFSWLNWHQLSSQPAQFAFNCLSFCHRSISSPATPKSFFLHQLFSRILLFCFLDPNPQSYYSLLCWLFISFPVPRSPRAI